MSDFKFYCCGLVAFVLSMMIFGQFFLPPRPAEVITAEGLAKIAAYKAEEHIYWSAMRHCDMDAPLGGMLCDHPMNELAQLAVRHARWTIARNQKFGENYDLEAQWILAHAK